MMIDRYFSEKIIDPIICGCIPIYYGCPSISDYFDMEGMLCFDSMAELEVIMDNFVNDDYYDHIKKIGVLKYNFEKAKQYLYPEDYGYDVLFKNLK
jgi:hypothetical protein